MVFLPVVERELRLALRKRPPAKARVLAAIGAAGLSILFLFLAFLQGGPLGPTLHTYLFLAGLYTVVIVPGTMCIGLLSEERRNQTLELLSLTGMRPPEVFLQKVLGGLLLASCDFLALVPFLALPFLAGGVSFGLFLATLVCMPLLLLFTMAVSMLASAVCNNDGAGLVFAFGVGALLSLATPLPYALGKTLTGSAPYSAQWLALSPGYAALLVGSSFSYGRSSEFWPAAGFTLLWTIVCFVLAGLVLKRRWKAVSDTPIHSWQNIYEAWLRGTERWRQNLRTRVIDHNPVQWLVQHERRPFFFAASNVAALVLVWLLGWCAWPNAWLSSGNFFLTAMMLLMIVEIHEIHAAARQIGNNRHAGNFELLLTTPLTPAQILAGHLDGLRQQFRPLRLMVLGLYLLMLLMGFLIRKWNVASVPLYLLIWGVFCFWILRPGIQRLKLTLWVAYNLGNPTAALLRIQRQFTWQWVWILFNLRSIISHWNRSVAQFPRGTMSEWFLVVGLGFLILIVTAMKLKDPATFHERFVRSIREIAQQPVPDPSDARLKQWKDLRDPMPDLS